MARQARKANPATSSPPPVAWQSAIITSARIVCIVVRISLPGTYTSPAHVSYYFSISVTSFFSSATSVSESPSGCRRDRRRTATKSRLAFSGRNRAPDYAGRLAARLPGCIGRNLPRRLQRGLDTLFA
jgi:hypothetical protein